MVAAAFSVFGVADEQPTADTTTTMNPTRDQVIDELRIRGEAADKIVEPNRMVSEDDRADDDRDVPVARRGTGARR